MRTVDYYFSFRSPYSYLSGPRAFALADEHDVEVVFRGVIPMAMRGQSVPRSKQLHTLRDTKREADRRPRGERRAQSAAVTDAALAACAAEEEAIRAVLRRRYNQSSVDAHMARTHALVRGWIIDYLRR